MTFRAWMSCGDPGESEPPDVAVRFEPSPEAVAALGYVGIFAGAIAYIAYFGLIDTAGAIRANLLFYVVPAVATLGGWALLGETISVLTVAGFLTIFAGFAVLGSESVAAWWATVDLPIRDTSGESGETTTVTLTLAERQSRRR